MPDRLSDRAFDGVLGVARTMFPHDTLPDEAYEKVVRKLAAAADAATIDAGLAELDAGKPFLELEPEEKLAALQRVEGSELFKLVHATAVVELYDNPLVWKAFGYEGPAVHLGGYVSRGFDDLDWLPEPQVAFDRDESPAAVTPETTHKFSPPPGTGAGL